MAKGRTFCVLAGTALLALAGCGHRFGFGERLIPESYGPPFGSALKANQPEHPHNPAAEERHAAADPEKNETFRSHAACNATLGRRIAAHGAGPERIVRISSIETLGHYEADGAVHEYRCTDFVLRYRAWCTGGSGHGEAHKKPEDSCKAEGTGH